MNLPDEEMAKFVTPGWLKRVGDVPIDEVAVMVCEDPSVVSALVGALRYARKQLEPKPLTEAQIVGALAQGRVERKCAEGDHAWISLLERNETLRKQLEITTAERDMFHALLCVVTLMDEEDRTTTVKVFRDSMPSLARLFRDGDGTALYLCTAVDRALDLELGNG